MSVAEPTARPPVVAGMFYPRSALECRQAVEDMFRHALPPVAGSWIGALVPHAGWICSGQVAADAVASMKAANPAPDLILIFGAVHTVGGVSYGALDDHASWETPLGEVPLAQEISNELARRVLLLRYDQRVHRRDHAIEVQLPLIRYAWEQTPILPIAVPPIQQAAEIGRQTAAALKAMDVHAIYFASSDLTHYGPDYGIDIAGEGESALQWARQNDRRLLEKIGQLQADDVVPETQENYNACGGGAIAALLGACLELGAKTAHLLRHTNSYEVLSRTLGRQRADNFVGYAAALVG